MMTLTLISVIAAVLVVLSMTPKSSVVQGHQLVVRTWCFSVKFDLRNAVHAEPVSKESLGRFRTLRIFGVGWPLKRFGWFYNSQLGTYLNLVDDPSRMWMVQFPKRKLLVSPLSGMETVATQP